MTELATLTVAETDVLTDCEDTISRGLMTFIEVGQALITIRDNRLYRVTHATFEDYCTQRWNFSFQRANQFIDAAVVTKLITTTTVAEINSTPAEPANEKQARPLAKLLPHPMAEPEVKAAAEEEIRETWAEAVETAPRDTDGQPKVTARHVEETVARRLDPEPEAQPPDRKQPNRKPLPDAFQSAAWDLVKVAERLERLVADDRFPRNAEQVGRMSRHDLLRAADLLATVVDRIPNPNKESTE
jgi:hypothetical protein